MGALLLSIASPDFLSWVGFAVLGAALVGEAGVFFIPARWEKLHKETAFGFAILAAAGYAIERVGDDAIIHRLELRAAAAEKKLAVRTLSLEQQKRIVGSLKWLSGTRYSMITYPEDAECVSLRVDLYRPLVGANWTFVQSQEWLGGGLVVGVVIDVAPSNSTALKPAADALSAALNAEGIAATVVLNPEHERLPNEIRIKVGKKP